MIDGARAAGVFPAATLEAGSSASPIWSDAFGTDLQTPFDLASLTKVITTTTVIMELVRDGALGLEELVSAFFGEWRGADRDAVTVRDLLEHASGLPARLLDAPPAGRREFEHDICAPPLEYAPRTQSIYSDLGFILLGFLAADRGGASLETQFDRLMVRLKPDLRRMRVAPALPWRLTQDVSQHHPAHIGEHRREVGGEARRRSAVDHAVVVNPGGGLSVRFLSDCPQQPEQHAG